MDDKDLDAERKFDSEDRNSIDNKIECSSCDESFLHTEVYRCGSCDTERSDEATSDLAKDFLCEMCVVCHIRKDHEVLDCKGYRPAICDKHKVISSMLCETCSEIFLSNAMSLISIMDANQLGQKYMVCAPRFSIT